MSVFHKVADTLNEEVTVVGNCGTALGKKELKIGPFKGEILQEAWFQERPQERITMFVKILPCLWLYMVLGPGEAKLYVVDAYKAKLSKKTLSEFEVLTESATLARLIERKALTAVFHYDENLKDYKKVG